MMRVRHRSRSQQRPGLICFRRVHPRSDLSELRLQEHLQILASTTLPTECLGELWPFSECIEFHPQGIFMEYKIVGVNDVICAMYELHCDPACLLVKLVVVDYHEGVIS